jgi:hypothetical protein
MTFLAAFVLVLLVTWMVFAIVDRIVGWAFARGERDPYPEDFLYADAGRLHREVDSEIERLSHWVPPTQYPVETAGPPARARGPYRSRTAPPRLGATDRQSDYGQSTSLVKGER